VLNPVQLLTPELRKRLVSALKAPGFYKTIARLKCVWCEITKSEKPGFSKICLFSTGGQRCAAYAEVPERKESESQREMTSLQNARAATVKRGNDKVGLCKLNPADL
jgi:hypothetical protein